MAAVEVRWLQYARWDSVNYKPGDTGTIDDSDYDRLHRANYVVLASEPVPPPTYPDPLPQYLLQDTTANSELDVAMAEVLGRSTGVFKSGVTASIEGAIETEVPGLVDERIPPQVTTPDIEALPISAWVGWTEPRAIALGGKTWVAVTGDKNQTYIDEYSETFADEATAPLWLRRYFVAAIPNDVTMDDHNNPAIIVKAGKPLVTIYSGHGIDGVLRWRKSRVNIEDGIDLGIERRKDLGNQDTTSYANCNTHGDNIYVLHRTGSQANMWSLTKSTDWAETFGTPVGLISAPSQFYCGGRVVGDTMRLVSMGHPTLGSSHAIFYCEINLTTGSITKSDGTVLGNLDGTNLPIAQTSLEKIADPPAGMVLTETVVGSATKPELLWTEVNTGSIAATGKYKYAVRVSGTWQIRDITTIGNITEGNPFGAAHLPRTPATQGRVYLSRVVSGQYRVERWDTANDGVSWTTTLLDTTPETVLQPWPVDDLDGTKAFEVAANLIRTYAAYTDWDGTVRPVPVDRLVKRYNPVATDEGTAAQVAAIGETQPPSTGLYLPGTSGNYVSLPRATVNTPATSTTPVRLEADVALDNWASGTAQALICKEDSNTTRSVHLAVNTDGKPKLSWSTDGSASASLIPGAPLPFLPGERATLRVDFWPLFNSNQRRVMVWYRRPGELAWTLHSQTQITTNVTVFDSTSDWVIGSRWKGTTDLAKGVFYAASVRTIGGNLYAGWRGDLPNSKYRDPKGNVWTVTGSGWAWAGPDTPA